jgi:WD40 repeat protein
MAWRPDSRRFVSASFDGTVKVWDLLSNQVALTLSGQTGAVVAVAWSNDGRRIASGGRDIKIWDADTGQEVLTLPGHASLVQSVSWSPDNRELASGSWDHTVRIWSAK